MPRFSFGITLYEYLNLMVLPGLEAFVHYFIRDILLRPYILPESITVPLTVRDSGLSQGVIMYTNTSVAPPQRAYARQRSMFARQCSMYWPAKHELLSANYSDCADRNL